MRNLWQLWSQGVDEATVDKIVEAGTSRQINDAGVFYGNKVDNSIRTSKVSWLTDETWIRELLFSYVNQANQREFHTSIYDNCDIQYTEYHGKDGGFYGWHHDVHWTSEDEYIDRKLTVTVQLSHPEEYTGGGFEFQEVQTPGPEAKLKGSVLVFPSPLRHRVVPVTSGLRRSLVAWFNGPRWN